MQELATAKEKYKYLFIIIMVFIVACIETDMYLPAFPDMMHYFHTNEAVIQSLLSWNFIGICLSGPFYGPLSDSFGRKKTLMSAMSLFSLGSIGTVFADQIEWMLIWRIIQGLGCGGAFTIGTAIIYDKFHHDEATKTINDLNCIIPVVMALAPMIGAYLNIHYGFRSNFTAIALSSLLTLAVCAMLLEETLVKEKRAPFHIRSIMQDFKKAMLCFKFWAPTIMVGLIFAGYLSYISYTALLFVNNFGVSRELYPLYQGSVLVAFVFASLKANTMINKVGTERLKRYGLSILTAGGLFFIFMGTYRPWNYNTFHFGMLAYAFGAGWLIGPFFTESMEALPEIKGIAASLTTSFRLLFTASFIGIVSASFDGSILPLVIGFVVLFTVGLVILSLTYFQRDA